MYFYVKMYLLVKKLKNKKITRHGRRLAGVVRQTKN
jgi:hypothetical protein